jgi:hypothetical protein
MAETQRKSLILVAAMAKTGDTNGAHHYNNTWMLSRIQLGPVMMSSQWRTLKLRRLRKNLALLGATSV